MTPKRSFVDLSSESETTTNQNFKVDTAQNNGKPPEKRQKLQHKTRSKDDDCVPPDEKPVNLGVEMPTSIPSHSPATRTKHNYQAEASLSGSLTGIMDEDLAYLVDGSKKHVADAQQRLAVQQRENSDACRALGGDFSPGFKAVQAVEENIQTLRASLNSLTATLRSTDESCFTNLLGAWGKPRAVALKGIENAIERVRGDINAILEKKRVECARKEQKAAAELKKHQTNLTKWNTRYEEVKEREGEKNTSSKA